MFDEAPARPAVQDIDPEIADKAVNALKSRMPENSAARVLSPSQRTIFLALLLMLTTAFCWFPIGAFLILSALATSYFLVAVIYRVLLTALAMRGRSAGAADAPPPSENALPTITILAPLYKDADALVSLAQAIRALDYPAHKKDVKLLLESDDQETLAETKRLGLGTEFDVIVVPGVGPRTKPKACNVGLYLAHGELVVIYDAEDQPERDQLLKAARAFQTADDELACVQAKLSYYNADENWLTRLFTLEYALWFDWMLPALQRLGAPIPLGGTSNFFRTRILIEAGGWDPFNVTEDADLGLRLSKLGYRVEMLDSTTFEEANCRFGNWIRQRSRWMKGHLQTWLVHMRRPQDVVATTGWHGLLSIQLFLAGNVFSALLNPALWAMFLFLQLADAPAFEHAIPTLLRQLNMVTLLAGNLCFATLLAIAPLKRGWRSLCLFGLTAPLYWLLTSLAAYKALWQIIVRPHYWEKTDHMLSRFALQRRRAALVSAGANKKLQPSPSVLYSAPSVMEMQTNERACRPSLSKNEWARQHVRYSGPA